MSVCGSFPCYTQNGGPYPDCNQENGPLSLTLTLEGLVGVGDSGDGIKLENLVAGHE